MRLIEQQPDGDGLTQLHCLKANEYEAERKRRAPLSAMAKLENLATENITSEDRQRLEQLYRMQAAYYRLIRSHQEAAEVVLQPITEVLQSAKSQAWSGLKLSYSLSSNQHNHPELPAGRIAANVKQRGEIFMVSPPVC